MFVSAARSLDRLRAQVATMRELAALPEGQLYATKESSKWSPSEHLDHIVRITISVLRGVSRDDLPPQPKGISMVGRVILTLGRIPRGKGKAPEKFRGQRVSSAALLAQLAELETITGAADADALGRRRGAIIPHPRFGGLTAAQALRFAAIHNDHHLRIIREILA